MRDHSVGRANAVPTGQVRQRPDLASGFKIQAAVVLGPSEMERGHVLGVLPLDDRPDWYAAAGDLATLLDRYLNAFGDKC